MCTFKYLKLYQQNKFELYPKIMIFLSWKVFYTGFNVELKVKY